MTPENQPEVILSDREKYHIPSNVIIDDFEEHLSIPDNLRIFFSAKFGTGKSYFLEEFFNMKADQYEVIKLYPVNYSTASNNDIFELIKFDILFHLIVRRQETIGSDIQLPELVKLQSYIHKRFTIDGVDSSLPIITALTSLAEGNTIISKVVPLVIGIFLDEKKKYKEYKTKLDKDNLSEADDFLSKIYQNTKEYGDDEPITAIIKEALTKLSEAKKTVLLIDDLDRLDPEHIFRILNIFGNHFSSSSGNKDYVNENKFGFDKVIFVGDRNNIESVFHHRYGEKADFNGYFSKYYSKKVFNFNLIKILELKFDKLNQDYFLLNNIEDIPQLSLILKPCITILLQKFINQGIINFRDLHKQLNVSIDLVELTNYGPVEYSLPYGISKYFIDFFGGKKDFLEVMNNFIDFNLDLNDYINRDIFNRLFYEINHHLIIPDIIKITIKDQVYYPNHIIEIDSYLNDSVYQVVAQINYEPYIPQLVRCEFYNNLEDIKAKNVKKQVISPSISFKKLYIKFINKYF